MSNLTALSVTIVFFIYDTFITFDRELASFWTPKQSGAALLFFANKWISMTIYVMDLVGFASLPWNKVSSLSPCRHAMSDLSQRSVGLEPFKGPEYCAMTIDILQLFLVHDSTIGDVDTAVPPWRG